MSEQDRDITHSEIFFSCTTKEYRSGEHFVPEHGLAHIYSGRVVSMATDKTHTIEEGETVLFSRNQLAKFTKYPTSELPCKSITIIFTKDFLQKYYSTNPVIPHNSKPEKVMRFSKHPLLDSLFNSVLPYYDLSSSLPKDLVDMKLLEAITILRKINSNADSILSDFAEPGKIDLVDFMNKNYAFNIPIDRFAYLTGRSLATFKRDFQKAFHTSPQRWLHQKRLEQAHFLIAEEKQKPSDVYLEVGFENLSHFSFAFKQLFGYNPSSL